LAAGEFIPIAEAGGLSLALDGWVLRAACRQARAWCDRGLPLRVVVNLSQAQLSHAGMLTTVEAALESTGASADCLELEITERFVMEGFSTTPTATSRRSPPRRSSWCWTISVRATARWRACALSR
jgi:EAL domain-containing protein (putative c-di-GMP-specific phosphodiesterase class I)